MSNPKKEHDRTGCPVGKFFTELDRVFDRKSDFFQHMNQSRIEFLKAMRSLIDAGIERCEKRDDKRDKPKMNTIKVE
jgi:hypothetical protein